MESRRFKLVVEYDGTQFAGFQLQGQGERTVQGVLEDNVRKLSGVRSVIHGAGRTDSGVHAHGQVVHFDTEWGLPADRLTGVLNAALPNDISVRSSAQVDDAFHARFSAKQRTYLYTMWTGRQRSALWCRYALHEPRVLDVKLMRAAAEMLVGRRDFGAFANKSEIVPPSMVRDLRLFDIRVAGAGKFILFRLSADGFLRSMVRNLIGGLRSVGLDEIEPDQLKKIADTADRTKNPCLTAPANGLCLWRVDY